MRTLADIALAIACATLLALLMFGCGGGECPPEGRKLNDQERALWQEVKECTGLSASEPRVYDWPASEPCRNGRAECYNGEWNGLGFRGMSAECSGTVYAVAGNRDRDAILRHEFKHVLLDWSDASHSSPIWNQCPDAGSSNRQNVSLSLTTGETGVIPPKDGQNAKIVIDGEAYDACKLAVFYSDTTQDKVDEAEGILYGPRPKTQDEQKKQMDDLSTRFRAIQESYGAVEVASAVCMQRPIKYNRLPEDWQADVEKRKKNPKVES